MIRIGMIGTGALAARVSATFSPLDDRFERYAVAARDEKKSHAFAERHGWKHTYAAADDLLADPRVDLVYITTTNPSHEELCRRAILAHKPVICEKPLAMSADGAREICALARREGVFLTEAIWPCYMPSRFLVTELLQEGAIGRLRSVRTHHRTDVTRLARITDPSLGGGALRDLGAYVFSPMLMYVGDEIVSQTLVSQTLLPSGVDGTTVIDLSVRPYGDDASETAEPIPVHIEVSCCSAADERFTEFTGTDGMLRIEGTNDPNALLLTDKAGHLRETIPVPTQITGYEYEFLACEASLEYDELTCPELTHGQSIQIQELIDAFLPKDPAGR